MSKTNLTIGELTDRAVDNTMSNKGFMKFAADRKCDGWSSGQSSQSSGWSQVGRQNTVRPIM